MHLALHSLTIESSSILADQYLLCCMLSSSLTTALPTVMRLLAVSTHAKHDRSIKVGSLPQHHTAKAFCWMA